MAATKTRGSSRSGLPLFETVVVPAAVGQAVVADLGVADCAAGSSDDSREHRGWPIVNWRPGCGRLTFCECGPFRTCGSTGIGPLMYSETSRGTGSVATGRSRGGLP